MPQVKNGRAAQVARKGIKRRIAKHNPVRQRGQGCPAATEIIGDSIFNITFPVKGGPEVYFTVRGDAETEHRSGATMYNDLYASFENLYKQVKGPGAETKDVSKCGVNMHIAFNYILNLLKIELLPSDYSFNIEYREDQKKAQQYYFVLYHHCVFKKGWHQLEIGPALLKLSSKNKPLHNLFLSFLRALGACGIEFWDQGFMGGTLGMLDETVLNYEDEGEEETAQKLDIAIHKYKDGDASRYRALIKKAPLLNPEDMQKSAGRYKNDAEIANLIYQGCEVLKAKCNIKGYMYNPNDPGEDEYYNGTYLDFPSQMNIIWDTEDALTIEHMESLDATANEGNIQEPVWSMSILSTTKNIDFLKYAEQIRWPLQLSQFFFRASDLLDKYLLP